MTEDIGLRGEAALRRDLLQIIQEVDLDTLLYERGDPKPSRRFLPLAEVNDRTNRILALLASRAPQGLGEGVNPGVLDAASRDDVLHPASLDNARSRLRRWVEGEGQYVGLFGVQSDVDALLRSRTGGGGAEGYQLVPIEPTEAMRDAGYIAATVDFDIMDPDCAKAVWAAMLSASPALTLLGGGDSSCTSAETKQVDASKRRHEGGEL